MRRRREKKTTIKKYNKVIKFSKINYKTEFKYIQGNIFKFKYIQVYLKEFRLSSIFKYFQGRYGPCYNVFLTTSFSQRQSHNVFLITSISQRLPHNVYLTTSIPQRHSHNVFLTTSISRRLSNVFLTPLPLHNRPHNVVRHNIRVIFLCGTNIPRNISNSSKFRPAKFQYFFGRSH